MIVDSSAVLAVLFREPDAETYEEVISTSRCRLSTANALESAIVAEGRRSNGAGELFDDFLVWSGIELVPVTVDHFSVARNAWRRFGKGRHPAALNFGDCFAYALAKIEDEPLLYKGFDFSHTDISSALTEE